MSTRKKNQRLLLTPKARAITPEEYFLIQLATKNVTGSSKINQKWSLYFRVLWQTGIRPSEGLGLKAQDIGEEYITITSLKKKGRPQVRIKVQPSLSADLRKFIADQKIRPNQKLFPETIQGAKYIFDKVKASQPAIRQWLTLHSFRHGFAVNFLNQAPRDVPTAEVLTWLQRALRHASIGTTGVYIQATDEQVEAHLDRMKF